MRNIVLTVNGWAAAYRAAGWIPLPLPHKSKIPFMKNWTEVSVDPCEFADGQNIGLILGSRSKDLTDIDLDCPEARELAPFFLPTTEAVFGRPSSPQSHWLYQCPGALTVKFHTIDGKMLLEIRTTGCQTMVPPSVHPSGERVQWAQGDGPVSVPASVEFSELRHKAERLAACTLLARCWPHEGARQDTAMALAGGMLRAGWNETDIEDFISLICRAAGDPEEVKRLEAVRYSSQKLADKRSVTGWPRLASLIGQKEVRDLQRWLHIAEPQKPEGDSVPGFNSTDVGNAQRLAQLFGERLKYVVGGKRGGWYAWNEAAWLPDVQAAERLAKEAVRDIYREAGGLTQDSQRKDLAKWALRSESADRIGAMLRLAQSEPAITARMDQFDTDPFSLNCQNGVLHLRTGKLYPHRPSDMMTRLAGTAFDPEAPCPLWQKFIDQATCDRPELEDFIQRCCGYALSGDTSEQVFFLLYGIGANGKSTFLEVLRDVLGDYGQQAEFRTFLRQPFGKSGPRDDIASLRGARLIAAGEVSAGKSFDEAILKQLTGGDSTRCRHLYGEEFEYRPQFKLFLAANHKPNLRPDCAMMRRVVLIPFEAVFPAEQQDRKLREKLVSELPGILAWMVRGCLDWQRDGLHIPDLVKCEVNEYRAENDPLASFIRDSCVIDQAAHASAADLYRAYCSWWESHPGERTNDGSSQPQNQKWFGGALRDFGLINTRHRNGIHWHGIGLSVT